MVVLGSGGLVQMLVPGPGGLVQMLVPGPGGLGPVKTIRYLGPAL